MATKTLMRNQKNETKNDTREIVTKEIRTTWPFAQTLASRPEEIHVPSDKSPRTYPYSTQTSLNEEKDSMRKPTLASEPFTLPSFPPPLFTLSPFPTPPSSAPALSVSRNKAKLHGDKTYRSFLALRVTLSLGRLVVLCFVVRAVYRHGNLAAPRSVLRTSFAAPSGGGF